MNNYFECYDQFVNQAFDFTDLYVLQLVKIAESTGMSKYEVDHAVKTYLINRFRDDHFVNEMIKGSHMNNFDFPGIINPENNAHS